MIGPVEDAVLELIRAMTATEDEAATLTRQVLEGEAYIVVNEEGVTAHPISD